MTVIAEPAFKPTARQTAARPLVRAWLLALAVLVLAMVVIGGATRLTGSGLSITEWAPVTGVVPPMSESAWQAEFDLYREIPQYRLVNRGMTLDEFKTIYWWEWGHRFLGRLLGVAFLVPFLWLVFTGRLERRLMPWVLGAFALGALQGVIGWYMVVSGLSERVSVSQYRLAIHLTLAAVIFAYLLWLAEGLRTRARQMPTPPGIRRGAAAILVLVFMQIFIGALVAGLHAGLAYPTWPLMDGRIIPAGLFAMEPWWRNLFENVATVQFLHRMTGYLLVAAALFHAMDCARRAGEGPTATRAAVLAVLTLAQAALGVATLLAQVPISLGLLHQSGAMAVLAAAVLHLHALTARPAGARSNEGAPATG